MHTLTAQHTDLEAALGYIKVAVNVGVFEALLVKGDEERWVTVVKVARS
jgi:hypothetical protein